jgi:uncharacterized protein
MEDSTFLGRGWSFPPTFSKSNKQLLLVSEENDIKESLHILLSTVPGERIMQPEFGCNLRSLVFENFSLSVQTMAKEMIRRSILFFESRVSVNLIDFNMEEIHNGYLQILLSYTVRSTNTRFNMVYPFYLREGTGINLT